MQMARQPRESGRLPVDLAPLTREEHLANTFAKLNRTQHLSYDAAASSAARSEENLCDTSKRLSYHVKDSQEVRLVAVVLQQQLRLHVPHTVGQIIDAAEYWPMSVATRKESHDERVAVHAFSGETASTPGPFLETNPVLGVAFAPVKKLVLRIVGRSQGWCDNINETVSYSWYEIASRRAAGKGKEIFHPGPTVARNEVFQTDYQTHEIVSYTDGSTSNELSEWLRGIRNGDTICLFPKAVFPGWANYTLSANIEVYTCGHLSV